MAQGAAVRWIAIAAVGVVVVVAAALAVRAWYERQPPPLADAGALRMTTESGGVPPPRYGIRLPDGSTTTLSLDGIGSRQGRPVGMVAVVPASGAPDQLTLAEGQSATAGGLTVTLVHIWQMPDHANDAVDVRAVAVRS
jgi:hypothetical protein